MTLLQFDVPGRVYGKARPRFNSYTKRAYTPAKTRRAEKNVETQAKLLWKDLPSKSAIRLRIVACFPIPKSWPKYKKQKATYGRLEMTSKPDLDNIAKIVLDALNELIYEDDKQIIELDIKKRYSVEFEGLIVEVNLEDGREQCLGNLPRAFEEYFRDGYGEGQTTAG